MSSTDSQWIKDRTREPCLLCGDLDTEVVGVFVPDEPWGWLMPPAPPNRVIGIAYDLCARCANRPTDRVKKLVEHVLWKRQRERVEGGGA